MPWKASKFPTLDLESRSARHRVQFIALHPDRKFSQRSGRTVPRSRSHKLIDRETGKEFSGLLEDTILTTIVLPDLQEAMCDQGKNR